MATSIIPKSRLQILVVEDNEIIAKIHKLKLTEFGFIPTIVTTGEEGFNEFITGFYDLLILDLGLPDTDGVKLAKKIRAYEKEHELVRVPIVIDSANGKDRAKECLEAGADVVLEKGCFDWDARQKLLRKLLKLK